MREMHWWQVACVLIGVPVSLGLGCHAKHVDERVDEGWRQIEAQVADIERALRQPPVVVINNVRAQ